MENETLEDEVVICKTGSDERRLASRTQRRRSDDSRHRNESTGIKFEKLKEMMNMTKIEGGGSTEDAEKEERREVAEVEEKKEGQSEMMAVAKLEEVATVIRLIFLAAAISMAEGKEENGKEEEEKPTELYVFLVVYTIIVATTMVFLPVIWKVGVRTWRSFSERIKDLLWSRSHPGEPEEEPKGMEEEKAEENVEKDGSTLQEDPQSEEVQEIPSGSQEEVVEGRMQIPTTPGGEERSIPITEEWEEIEREEARIRREVRLGMPPRDGNQYSR